MIDVETTKRKDLQVPCPCENWRRGCKDTCRDETYLATEKNRSEAKQELERENANRYWDKKNAIRRNRAK